MFFSDFLLSLQIQYRSERLANWLTLLASQGQGFQKANFSFL